MLTGRRYSSLFFRACKKKLAVDQKLSTFYHFGVAEIFLSLSASGSELRKKVCYYFKPNVTVSLKEMFIAVVLKSHTHKK